MKTEKKVFRVSEILMWAGLEKYPEIPEEKREFFLERGQKIHEITSAIDAGEEIENIPEEVLPYIISWRNFSNQYKIEIIENEKRITRENITGQIDRIIFSPTLGEVILIDIKTSHFRNITRLQLAAYAELNETPNIKRGAVVLTPVRAIWEAFSDYEIDNLAWRGLRKLFFSKINKEKEMQKDDWQELHALVFWKQKYYSK